MRARACMSPVVTRGVRPEWAGQVVTGGGHSLWACGNANGSDDHGMATRKKVHGRKFPAELRNIIDDVFGGNMAEYARQSRVVNGTLGHYLVSNRYPTPDRFERLLKPLPAAAQGRLLEAYLMDLTPPAVRGQVKVQSGSKPSLKPAKVSEDLGLNQRTLSALDFTGRLAAESLPVRLMVEQTARALGWKG